jgi:hypothetical protein
MNAALLAFLAEPRDHGAILAWGLNRGQSTAETSAELHTLKRDGFVLWLNRVESKGRFVNESVFQAAPPRVMDPAMVAAYAAALVMGEADFAALTAAAEAHLETTLATTSKVDQVALRRARVQAIVGQKSCNRILQVLAAGPATRAEVAAALHGAVAPATITKRLGQLVREVGLATKQGERFSLLPPATKQLARVVRRERPAKALPAASGTALVAERPTQQQMALFALEVAS